MHFDECFQITGWSRIISGDIRISFFHSLLLHHLMSIEFGFKSNANRIYNNIFIYVMNCLLQPIDWNDFCEIEDMESDVIAARMQSNFRLFVSDICSCVYAANWSAPITKCCQKCINIWHSMKTNDKFICNFIAIIPYTLWFLTRDQRATEERVY